VTGCNSKKGVCGKDSTTAGLQDLQIHYNVGLAQWATAVLEKGGNVPDETKRLFLDSTFATLTNVNFDANRFYDYLGKTDKHRNELKKAAESLGVSSASLQGPAQFQYKVRIQISPIHYM
jgi:hydroxylamine reductase